MRGEAYVGDGDKCDVYKKSIADQEVVDSGQVPLAPPKDPHLRGECEKIVIVEDTCARPE